MTVETIRDDERVALRELCDKGLFLQAHAAIAHLPPPNTWVGPESVALAARILYPLGAQRASEALALRGVRRYPSSSDLRERAVFVRLARRGGLVALRMLEGAPAPETPAEQAAILGVRAHVAANLRDFDTADAAIERALQLDPNEAWLYVVESAVRSAEDRYDEALVAARRALAMQPGLGSASASLAHLLQLVERDEEAIDVLRAGVARTEIAYLAAQLAHALLEADRTTEALAAVERAAAYAPLAEASFTEGLRALRFDAAYREGRYEDARREGAAMASPFYQRQVQRMATTTGAVILRCEVPFVRQHHLTCGPATLTALALSFGASTDHLAVADAICWGGTHGYAERRWALKNGFAAREFRLTVEAARALLGRAVPFAVATQETTSGHLQAVIGHDPRRGVMLVRDPYYRHTREWLDEEFLERYRSSGPRAMAIVPLARAEEIAALDLPDADLFDHLFAVHEALRDHDHAAARRAHAQLAEHDPDHALTILSRWSLSAYERDTVGILACIERSLAMFPADQGLLLRKLAALEALGRGAECRAILEDVAGKAGPVDPAFLLQLAAALARDPTARHRQRSVLRRAERFAAGHAGVLHALATWRWERHEQAEATELFRLAACADEVSEGAALNYFQAARSLGREEEALAVLRRRVARHGRKSEGPAASLFRALDALSRTHEGLAVLEDALVQRPDDGALLLFAAEMFAANGRGSEAELLLQRSRGRASEVQHFATAARIAERAGEPQLAQVRWREVIARDPLHWPAHHAIPAARAVTEGRAAAARHLGEVVEAFPFLREPRGMLAQFWGAQDAPEAASALRDLLELDPGDAWARRELALRLLDLGEREAALAEIEHACELDPTSAPGHGIRARVLQDLDREGEAAVAALQAVRLDPDDARAVHQALVLAPSASEREAALETVFELLASRGTGEGAYAFFHVARALLTPAEVDAKLDALVDRRPTLWQPRALQVQRDLEAGRHDAAQTRAERLVADHPLLPATWMTLAEVCAARDDDAGQRRALRGALAINPGYGAAVRQLFALLCREGDFTTARVVAERAVAHDASSAGNLVMLGRALARLGEDDAARSACERAIRVDPQDDVGWDGLRDVAGSPAVTEFARVLVAERPHDAELWGRLATDLPDLDARLEAWAKARRLRPDWTAPYDSAAELLGEQGRIEAATAWLATFPGGLPFNLRGRAAWLHAQAGDFDGAIEAMRAVVAEVSRYAWGWRHLCSWLSERERWSDLRAAARSLIDLQADDPLAHAHLAEAHLRLEDRGAAITALTRALDLAPGYRWALWTLVRAHLDAKQIDAADAVVQRAQLRAPGPATTAVAVAVAAARADAETAHDLFVTLGSDAEAGSDELAVAADFLRRAGMLSTLQGAVVRLVEAEQPHPFVARLWVEMATETGKWHEAVARLQRLVTRGASWRDAAMFVLEALSRARSPLLSGLVHGRLRDSLRGDDLTWGQAGFALLTAGQPIDAIEWMADWRARTKVEPWMADNLVHALRVVGRSAEAAEVSEWVLTRASGPDLALHAAWLAVDAVVAGDDARASELRARVPIGGYAGLLAGLVDAHGLLASEGIRVAASALRRAAAAIRAGGASKAVTRAIRAIATRIAVGQGGRGWWLRVAVWRG